MTHQGHLPAQVSVVIPHYGDAAPTLSLLSALTEQLGHDGQIIVVDDCSPVPFPHTEGVEVIRRPINGGFGSAVNTGAEAATRDMLLILNSDLEVGSTFVRDLMCAADVWMPCIAGPRIVTPLGHVDPTARHFPRASHQIVEWLIPLARWRHLRRMHEAVGHDMSAVESGSPRITDWLVGAVLLLPTAKFREVGGFDERFHMNAEEVDLQRRLRERGIPSVYFPTVAVVHEGGGSSDPSRRRRWLVQSRWRYAQKWGGTATLRVGLTAATAANLIWNTGRRLLGRDIAPLATAREEIDLIWGDGSR